MYDVHIDARGRCSAHGVLSRHTRVLHVMIAPKLPKALMGLILKIRTFKQPEQH